MPVSFLTLLQIFGIGFSLSLFGPCVLTCTPILMTYIAGSRKGWADVLKDIAIFLTGRLSAYCILGALAGFSAGLIRQYVDSNTAAFFQPLGGAISILLGILILIYRSSDHPCGLGGGRIYNFGGLFALGLIIGISPCAPLIALLFEISLISKSAADGMIYALSFGLGTALSGFIVIGALAKVFTWVPAKILKSQKGNLVFKILCAALLMLLGLSLIIWPTR